MRVEAVSNSTCSFRPADGFFSVSSSALTGIVSASDVICLATPSIVRELCFLSFVPPHSKVTPHIKTSRRKFSREGIRLHDLSRHDVATPLREVLEMPIFYLLQP
jgi:hypothetical protein